MYTFEENKCRACKKLFCCETCREKHEKLEHNINHDCNICLYGKIRISEVTDTILSHLQSHHWPLHCVWCKKEFISPEDIHKHVKCPVVENVYSNINVFSPPLQISTENCTFESPPLTQDDKKNPNKMSNLATSTPLQINMDNLLPGLELQKIRTVVITPLNSADCTRERSILKKSGYSGSPLKRRVTFCETILVENMSQDENQNNQPCNMQTPTTEFTESFHTACEGLSNKDDRIFDEAKTPLTPKRDFEEYNTPGVTPNLRKKQIKAVKPMLIGKLPTTSTPNGPIQISSTPNNPLIPTKTVPTAKQILFRLQDAASSSTNDYSEIRPENHVSPFGSGSCSEIKNQEISDSHKNSPKDNEDNQIVDSSSSFKRTLPDYESDFEPKLKRYRLAEVAALRTVRDLAQSSSLRHGEWGVPKIRGRRPVRDSSFPSLTNSNRGSGEIHINIVNNVINNFIKVEAPIQKTFVDKATQTDDDELN